MAEAEMQSIELPAIVDLDTLDDVRDQLLQVIEHGSIIIKADKVERVATNALLMMLSAANSAKQNDVSFEISNPSAPMMGAVDRLGLNDNFTSLIKGQSK